MPSMPDRGWIRPQSFVMTLLGTHALGRDVAIAITSYVEICKRIGISEQATRSTLARMRSRGLLRSERAGRRAYLALTARGEAVLRDGQARLGETLTTPWDGHWTLVAVTLPTGKESERHLLRSRLLWAGFGGLSNGLWIVPRRVNVKEMTRELDLDAYVRAFSAEMLEPTTPELIIADGYDLAGIAKDYEAFLRRWRRPDEVGADVLVRNLLLYTDWLLVTRENPRLPIDFLPQDWPGFEAEATFNSLADQLRGPAAAEAREVLDMVELDLLEVAA
jgi:phenylacetic acid degradation operon negative regulatory protein